jgi:hypothetical protein
MFQINFRAGLRHPALKEEGGEMIAVIFNFEFLNLNVAQISPPNKESARLCHFGGEWIQVRHQPENVWVLLNKPAKIRYLYRLGFLFAFLF